MHKSSYNAMCKYNIFINFYFILTYSLYFPMLLNIFFLKIYFYMATNFYQNFQKGKDSVKEYEYVHNYLSIYTNYFPEESMKQWIP